MPNFAVASDAFRNTFRSWRLWLIQILGSAALFGLFVLLLWIPVATTAHLALNLVAAALFTIAVLYLQAGTLRFFATLHDEEHSSVATAFRAVLRHLPAFAIAAILLCAAWYFAGTADKYQETLPNYLRSESPLFVRNLVSLHAYENLVAACLFALQWIIAPGLVLPFLAATSSAGFAGFARPGFSAWKKCAGHILYWAIVAACAVIGVHLIGKLMDWTPDFRTSTFSQETASLIWRGLLSYFLILWAWMFVCSVTGRLQGEAVDVSKSVRGQTAA